MVNKKKIKKNKYWLNNNSDLYDSNLSDDDIIENYTINGIHPMISNEQTSLQQRTLSDQDQLYNLSNDKLYKAEIINEISPSISTIQLSEVVDLEQQLKKYDSKDDIQYPIPIVQLSEVVDLKEKLEKYDSKDDILYITKEIHQLSELYKTIENTISIDHQRRLNLSEYSLDQTEKNVTLGKKNLNKSAKYSAIGNSLLAGSVGVVAGTLIAGPVGTLIIGTNTVIGIGVCVAIGGCTGLVGGITTSYVANKIMKKVNSYANTENVTKKIYKKDNDIKPDNHAQVNDEISIYEFDN